MLKRTVTICYKLLVRFLLLCIRSFSIYTEEEVAPAIIVGRACVIRASSRALVCGFTLPSCRGFVVLSKVFVFAIFVSSVLITCVE